MAGSKHEEAEQAENQHNPGPPDHRYNVKKKMEESKVYLVGYVLLGVSTVINLMTFFSPYWWVSYEEANSKFVRIGLWEACFDEYIHPQDYKSKAYGGCSFIFSEEFRPLYEWLSPPWFIGVQLTMTLSVLFEIVLIVLSTLHFMRYCEQKVSVFMVLGLAITLFITAILQIIALLIFGILSEDRLWMPRPDMCHLSWSFIFGVFGSFITIAAGFMFLIESKILWKKYKRDTLLPAADEEPGYAPQYGYQPPPQYGHQPEYGHQGYQPRSQGYGNETSA